jgi:hypothetical protein
MLSKTPKYILTVFLLLASLSFCQEMTLDVGGKEYRSKDNVFVEISGQKENLRLKVFGPDFKPVLTYALLDEGKYFFQVTKSGKYLVEASDATTDVTETLSVVGSDDPIEVCPDSKIGKDIYKELKKVLYVGSASDSKEIAKIFLKNKGKEPAQKLINDTFTEIKEFLKDNPKRKEWEGFFAFLQKYYADLGYLESEMDKYASLWADTAEAFNCKGNNP